jgi:alpha-glucuronidase
MLSIIAMAGAAMTAFGEDGYRLWLRYEPLSDRVRLEAGRKHVGALIIATGSPTFEATQRELLEGMGGLLGTMLPVVNAVNRDGTLVVGTPKSLPLLANLGWQAELEQLGSEGFLIRSRAINGHPVTVIASKSDIGAMYGAFHLLRLVQTGQSLENLDISQRPHLRLRLLNHWDNLSGSIERGYAGRSLWNWQELPGKVDQRLLDYARANASLGLNGSVLNNVNAKAASLTSEYLKKTAAIADAWRPYGIRVYLTARFSAPVELDGLKTADPLDPQVIAWWKQKADEIYALIPDFGGFLVKANSEGQPGPRTYGRTHVDGANMMAAALAPHGGVVMWRAFIYDNKTGEDRAAQAYDQLKPFDGRFASNVLLQVKNGPVDFQPREPFHPLFGAMPKTSLLPELQITQEYMGHANHLVFLAPMWQDTLQADTCRPGPGATVARVIDGSLDHHQLTGIAGVANTGTDRNWCGHPIAQANWYAFGRLAWDPSLDSRRLAREWVRMTFSADAAAEDRIVRLLLDSHEAVVNYMMPLGLHHIMAGDHYTPAPWGNIYSHADQHGLGFDRTETGSKAVDCYAGAARERFTSPTNCPEEYLLWFHHVSWDYRMRSGRTLWEELCLRYQAGVDWVRAARHEWSALAGVIDKDRHQIVADKLAVQEQDAMLWRDACLLYFRSFSHRPLPAGVEPPKLSLADYMAQHPPAKKGKAPSR